MKRKSLIYILVSFMLLTGCTLDSNKLDNVSDENTAELSDTSSNDVIDNTEGNESEDTIDYTIFNALGTTYSGNKKITDLGYKDEICNYSNYVRGQYKEVDFAIDLIYKLLEGDESVFNSIISLDDSGNIIDLTDEDKNDIKDNLKSLKVDQLGMDENSALYFNFVSAEYFGEDGSGYKLYIRGNIGAPLTSYFVTVYEKNGTLLGKIK